MSSASKSPPLFDSEPPAMLETTPLISNPSPASNQTWSPTSSTLHSKRRIRSKARLLNIFTTSKPFSKGDSAIISPNTQRVDNIFDQDAMSSPTSSSQSGPIDSPACATLNNVFTSPLPHSKCVNWTNWNLIPAVSLVLENSGSVARDHLASERTFLAYVRTSLAIVSSGVAVVQLLTITGTSSAAPLDRNVRHYARPLGAITIILGIIVLLIGVVRYFAIQSALTKGFYPAARWAVTTISFALAVLVTFTFGILVAFRLG